MQMWFSQYHTANVKLDVRIQEQLFSGQSDYQKIDVFKSYEFGKMVAVDGESGFSDADVVIYVEVVGRGHTCADGGPPECKKDTYNRWRRRRRGKGAHQISVCRAY